MSEHVNNLLSGYLQPDQRRRIANALMANQFDRPTPQDYPVQERAGVFPLATYANGQTGIAWPGFVAQPVQAFNSLLQRGYQGGTGDTQGVQDAFDVAGAAMTGGLLAPRPRGSIGMSGRPQEEIWWHGTPGDAFDKFDMSKAGGNAWQRRFSGRPRNPMAFLADQKSHAEAYGNAIPFSVRGKTHTVNAAEDLESWAKELNYKDAQEMIKKHFADDIYLALDADNYFNDVAAQAKKTGASAAIVDFGPYTGDRGKVGGRTLMLLDADQATRIY